MILLWVPLARKKLQEWSRRLAGNFVSTKVVEDAVIVIVPGLLPGKDAFLLFAHNRRQFFASQHKAECCGQFHLRRRLFADAVILIATYLLSGECVPFPSPPIAKNVNTFLLKYITISPDKWLHILCLLLPRCFSGKDLSLSPVFRFKGSLHKKCIRFEGRGIRRNENTL